jgi:hypothetical protein
VNYVIPKFADILITYALWDQHTTICDPSNDFSFIRTFCEEVKKNSQKDLISILTTVNGIVLGKSIHIEGENKELKQVPTTVMTFTKKLYLKSAETQ